MKIDLSKIDIRNVRKKFKVNSKVEFNFFGEYSGKNIDEAKKKFYMDLKLNHPDLPLFLNELDIMTEDIFDNETI